MSRELCEYRDGLFSYKRTIHFVGSYCCIVILLRGICWGGKSGEFNTLMFFLFFLFEEVRVPALYSYLIVEDELASRIWHPAASCPAVLNNVPH